MCLVTNSKTAILSDKPISCFKILVHVGNKLISPYMDFPFNTNTTYTDEIEETFKEFQNYVIVEKGFFHAYRTIETAIKEADIIRAKLKKLKVEIYNAEIPSNVSYYTGQSDDCCSKSLTIKDLYD